MKFFKIILTNWIHLIGFYITTYLSLILFKIIGLEPSESWYDVTTISLFTIPLLFITYGLPIIGGVYLTIILLDLLGYIFFRKYIKEVLFFECVLIIPPFISWAFEYEYWLWLTLSASFIITQFIRGRLIEKKLKINMRG